MMKSHMTHRATETLETEGKRESQLEPKITLWCLKQRLKVEIICRGSCLHFYFVNLTYFLLHVQ